jgi:ParB family chromosome partitioning protein
MTGKKPALGKGLAALLPGRADGGGGELLREVELSRIHPGRFQPRSQFDPKALADLAQSIRANGLVQPILVARREGGGYTIVAGERRFRAAQQAGLAKVPVVVRENLKEADFLELALVENLQREDLNPLEEAAAYGRLREEFQLTQDQIAERVGKDRSTVANSLRILKLPSIVRERIRNGALSAGHAKAVAALASGDDQVRLAEEIVRRSLSVRQAEKRAAAILRGPAVRRERKRDPFAREAEEKLSRRLHARVRLTRRRRGGTLSIDFASEGELIRLYEILMRKA